MKQIIEKLASLERDIASEKGEFSLFALFLREDADNKWDFLASAPWLEANNRESLDYLANQLRARLDTQELLSLSMIVLLEQDNPVLEAIHKVIKVRHGMAEVRDSIFSGVPIKHAYIITSKREHSPRNRTPQPA
jgi:hypothetical protein